MYGEHLREDKQSICIRPSDRGNGNRGNGQWQGSGEGLNVRGSLSSRTRHTCRGCTAINFSVRARDIKTATSRGRPNSLVR